MLRSVLVIRRYRRTRCIRTRYIVTCITRYLTITARIVIRLRRRVRRRVIAVNTTGYITARRTAFTYRM